MKSPYTLHYLIFICVALWNSSGLNLERDLFPSILCILFSCHLILTLNYNHWGWDRVWGYSPCRHRQSRGEQQQVFNYFNCLICHRPVDVRRRSSSQVSSKLRIDIRIVVLRYSSSLLMKGMWGDNQSPPPTPQKKEEEEIKREEA